jgi:hypothetical protein
MLGLDEHRAPPEKSIYLAVLQQGKVHVAKGGTYTIVEPSADADPCHLQPAFAHIHRMLTTRPDVRVDVATVVGELCRSPYGVRDGVWPLLLTIYIKAHEHELALYERGTYMTQLGGAELLRVMKAPESFEMQLCEVVGVRAEVFDRLLTLLDVSAPPDRQPVLLDVVTPLYTFAAGLPEYVRRTSVLSEVARAVRGALVDAREPVRLLFHDLPMACGLQPFTPGAVLDDARVQSFVQVLRGALDELRGAYAGLQARNEAALFAAMGVADGSAGTRMRLSARARRLQIAVREVRLKAFCIRVADDALPPDRWMEAVGSLVVSKPPSKWTDGDERLYVDEVTSLGEMFRRVEAVAFAKGEGTNGHSAVRVLLTRSDGREVMQVIDVIDADEGAVVELEARISAILAESDQLGLAATSRVFWKALAGGTA